MNKKKKLFIWNSAIDSMLRNENIGGLAIQLNHWANIFIQEGWEVYSLSTKESRKINGINFLKLAHIRIIGIFFEIFLCLFYLLRYRPQLIMLRGAGRQLSYVNIFAKIISAKVVFMGASDTDFIKGKELIASEKDKKLYRYGVKRTNFFIVQNDRQKDFLEKNYGTQNCLIIPNIWPQRDILEDYKDIDFLWVSNFRELKRPMWFIEMARANPTYKFTMIGGPYNIETYSNCKEVSKSIPNLSFLGPKSIDEVDKYFTRSRAFVCTSEIEGFPNTFLQAWSNNIPVITTFDPSNIIKQKSLGITCSDLEELNNAIDTLCNNKHLYDEIKDNVEHYFKDSHNPKIMYHKLINTIKIGK